MEAAVEEDMIVDMTVMVDVEEEDAITDVPEMVTVTAVDVVIGIGIMTVIVAPMIGTETVVVVMTEVIVVVIMIEMIMTVIGTVDAAAGMSAEAEGMTGTKRDAMRWGTKRNDALQNTVGCRVQVQCRMRELEARKDRCLAWREDTRHKIVKNKNKPFR